MKTVRFTGALRALSAAERAALLERSFSTDGGVEEAVRVMLREVRGEGDDALRRYARRFDGVTLERLEVPREAWRAALASLEPAVRAGLERAARNLATVARASVPPPFELEVEPGVVVGRRADPLERVGVYAPGGRAAYPSSVLMGAVPARAAGVKEVVLCSPPQADGRPSAVVLAAAELAGVSRVFAVGGAGAIGAMAFGTGTVPRVDRIVGPGNAWVAEAKRQVAGEVGIDSPAGPSEILVIADARADAERIARELLAQAEHDADACCVALVTTPALADAVLSRLASRLPFEPRRDTIARALAARGAVLTVDDVDEAVAFANAFAPEHLQLALAEPGGVLEGVRNAGTVFVGGASSVAFGDYLTGANHVLPTAGAARRFSGLSALDFVRWTTWQRVTPSGAAALSADVVVLATSEGLPAHARAGSDWPAGEPVVRGGALRRKANLADVARYVPTRPPCEIDLTDNTNLFGLPDTLRRTLAEAPLSAVSRYPSPYADALRAALAESANVAPEEVVTGCGSDDLLDAAMRAFASPGDRLAYCPPTFGIVPTFARTNGVTPVAVPLELGALSESGARLVYLCSPNNPTGAALPEGFVDALLERTDAVVLLDEAYGEFMDAPSLVARRHPRLVVVKTLSKAFGLAGLRLGWAAGEAGTIAELEKTRGPYKVGGLAERAGVAMLGERDWVQRCVAESKALRARFSEALRDRGFTPLPSQANFVLVPVRRAEEVTGRMRERGVSVRGFPGLPGIGDAVRITVAPWPMLEACLAALTEAAR